MLFFGRFAALFRRSRLDREMDEELRAHLERETERNVARGLSPTEARYAALRAFGGVEQLKEREREARGWTWLESLLRDLQFAARSLRKNPGFTAVAVLVLALGIGTSGAVFSVVEAFLLRALPYPAGEQLVAIRCEHPGVGRANVGVSVPELEEMSACTDAFAGVSMVYPMHGNLTGVSSPQRVEAIAVSPSFFRLLGVKPALGRTFGPEEEQVPGWAEGCVISHAAWQRYFGGDPGVLGRKISLDYDPYRIVGVMPPGFRHPGRTAVSDADVWFTGGLRSAPFTPDPRRTRRIIPNLIARLQPGVSVELAQARLDRYAAEIREQFPANYPVEGRWRARATPLQRDLVGNVRPVLWLLSGAVAVVLLICCSTLANLLLVRAGARRSELAVRQALGASRARVARLLVTESLLVSLGGALAGLALAWQLPPLIAGLAPASLPRVNDFAVNSAVLGFTLTVSVVTGIVFGLIPAWQGSRLNPVVDLKSGGRGPGMAVGARRIRAFFASAQVALSAVLLVIGGLLCRSFWNAVNVHPGFDPHHLTVAQSWLPPPTDPRARQTYLDPANRVLLAREVMRRLQALPGVTSVAAGTGQCLPFAGRWSVRPLQVEGGPEAVPGAANPTVISCSVTPGYCETMGIPLYSGRMLAESDIGGNLVAVINRAAAERYWPGQSPIGRRVSVGSGPPEWSEIVGVIGNVKTESLDAPDVPLVCFCLYQRPGSDLTWFVRSAEDNPGLLESIRREIQAADRDLPVFGTAVYEQLMTRSLAYRRFAVTVVAAFAGMALLLAGLGVYGVVALSVTQRTHEIGIRVALGASSRDVITLVLREGVLLALAGTAVGLLATFAAVRLVASFLFGISQYDLATFASVLLVLAMVTLMACLLPAWRALHVQPMRALRDE